MGRCEWSVISNGIIGAHGGERGPITQSVDEYNAWSALGRKKGKVPDRGVLFDRREDYGIGRGPCGGCVLTVGVDV